MPYATPPGGAPRRAKPPLRIITRRASEPSATLLQILRQPASDARNISSSASDPASFMSRWTTNAVARMDIQNSGGHSAHAPTPEQKEIDRVLYLRRISQARSCYPCRQRKVKCDHGQPCRTCQKRGHPEICSYTVGTPEKRRGRRAKRATADGTTPQGTSASASANRAESEQQQGKERPSRQDSPQSEASSNQTPAAAPLATATELASTVAAAPCSRAPQANCYRTMRREHYQGDSSVLAMLHGSADSPAVEMRRKAGPVLGLHNTLEFYPFMKLKTIQERWAALLKLIPQKQEVLRYFPSHGATIYPLNPVLIDPDDLESAYCDYLSALEAGELKDPNVFSPKWVCKAYISRIALLLAALATSAHYSVMQSPRRRSEHCRDYIQRAFDCLRLANYVLHPSLDVVQTLLIIGTVLQDVGQSDGAWVMLGTTVRVAQALGLHTLTEAQLQEDKGKKKQALWDMICKQDCLLSLCHGRPHIATRQSLATNNLLYRSDDALGFSDMMCGIVSVCMRLLNLEQPSCEASLELLTELDGYQSRALPYLEDRNSCRNIQQRYENLTIQIQLSFTASVIARPALTRTVATTNEEINNLQILKRRAKESLMSTAKSFIEFQSLSIIPIRTWSLIHAVLSATIMLCLWEETRNDTESRDVMQRVMEIFSRAAQADDETGMMSDNNPWLSMSHTRALVALQSALQNAPALTSPAATTSTPSSLPEQQLAEKMPPQHYALPRMQDAGAPPLDPTMDGPMSYNFTSMLIDGFSMDAYSYPWDTSGVSPLMYLDQIMKGEEDTTFPHNDPSFGPS
ncbi:hypothetical protein ACSS6W_010074 [Trichoderma asperelloides]|uniref:Sorbicillinoid biosynthetic cluster transcription factor sor3 n=1 Tax=Trichoderma asperellum TaxID=101201 RepID=A0A6V8QZU2_TRIAP|nr:sorbicillinoid biosynthetic cluster transcription factor sor3 [Trichoderma asperellum]